MNTHLESGQTTEALALTEASTELEEKPLNDQAQSGEKGFRAFAGYALHIGAILLMLGLVMGVLALRGNL